MWALSHQLVVVDGSLAAESSYGASYGSGTESGSTAVNDGLDEHISAVFPHAEYVTATNLTAGALIGLVLGIYNIRSRRHYRVAQQERKRVARQRTRLSVLNRVLRHNLRNDATVILGHIEHIAAQADEQIATHARTVEDKVMDLVAMGKKARQIDESIGDDMEYADEFGLRELVEDVVESSDLRAEAEEVTVDIPDTLTVTSNKDLVTKVVEEILENTVEHGGSDPVRIRVTARYDTDDWIDLTVEDSGPGIPPHEVASLDSGNESPLEHTTGLGLWLVRWGVTAIGGEVTFEESDWGGTNVHIRLPTTPETAGMSLDDDAALNASQERPLFNITETQD